MKAIRPKQIGGPEILRLEEVSDQTPGEREVLVRVEAAGVNYIDVYHLTGLYPMPLPIRIGLEGAGTVEEVGSALRELRPGARVAWTAVPGSYATHVIAAAEKLVEVPEGVDSQTAAALMLQGMTAHYLARSTFPLREGHTALVHAAAGGVGLLLVQLAKRSHARVIGTVSTEAKAALAKEAGADEIINYKERDFVAETKLLTGGRGVDVVYDSVGRATFDGSLQVLAPRGHLVLFGQSSGPVAPFDPARLSKGSYSLTRPTLVDHTATRAELLARSGELFDLVKAGQLRVRVGHTYALAEAEEAIRALTGRQTTGKILLIP